MRPGGLRQCLLQGRDDGLALWLQVELSPANLVLEKPCLLKIPHFAADPRGEKQMFIAAYQEPDRSGADGEEVEAAEAATFTKLTHNAQFNISTGYATVWIMKLGTFYVCSDITDGIDYAVTSYSIPSHVEDQTFNAVGFDWIEGEANLWTRTSLDRPPGKDGPVYVRRKARLTVSFDANRIAGKVRAQAPDFPDTFVLASNNYNLLTGVTEEGYVSKTNAHAEPFDSIEYQVLVVPGHKMEIIEEKKAALEQMVKDFNIAKEQAEALGTPLDTDAQQPYLDRIQDAKVDLKDTRHACLPWSETQPETESDAPSGEAHLPAASSDAPLSTDEATKGSQDVTTLVDAHAPAQQDASGAEGASQKQSYKDLPAWEGKDLNIVFGAQMMPDVGFQEDHMTTHISIVTANKHAEERRLLEVPEMPGPGGRFRKVWVGPPKDKIFEYPPILTRASFAGELSAIVLSFVFPHPRELPFTSAEFALPNLEELTMIRLVQSWLSTCSWVRGLINVRSQYRQAVIRSQTCGLSCSRTATAETFPRRALCWRTGRRCKLAWNLHITAFARACFLFICAQVRTVACMQTLTMPWN